MFGAIAGDVIGSVFEFQAFKSAEFPLFSAGGSGLSWGEPRLAVGRPGGANFLHG
jgi:hypothetical protein